MSLTRFRIFLLSLCLFLCAFSVPVSWTDYSDHGHLPKASMNDRILSIPVSLDPLVRLEVTLFMPVSGGPFPLVVLNHGASQDPPNAPRLADNFTAYYFLSRGYAVVLPLMRGYANSEGHLHAHGCDVGASGLEAAADIHAVIDAVRTIPGIDSTRIIVAGKSMGGWNTLALGTLGVPNVVGLVSFAGGVKESDCGSPDAALVKAAGQYGAHTKIPSIWIFGDNDSIFPTKTWQAMFQQYTAAGAPSELVDIGNFQKDAHTFTASGAGLPLWVPKLDAFLDKIGMPSKEILSVYMPAPAPQTTPYAQINDVAAVPFLTTAQRQLYMRFLTLLPSRAFVVGLGGGYLAGGGFDPSARAMDECWAHTRYCQLYAVDNTVVWPRQTDAPPPTQFAALNDASMGPYLDAKGRAAYANFLISSRPRAFAIAPDGSFGAATGLDSMNTALNRCGQGHTGCRLYAVDGDVVWTNKAP